MTFGREKRRLVGLAALLAPLPLPFNAALSWPVLVIYLACVGSFLARSRRDPGRWLPAWAMNGLGVAYIPFFLLDATVLSAGSLVEPVVHLLLFGVVAKLFSLARERDKWQALLGISFIFLAAMATSVHPSVTVYLVAYLTLLLFVFARFAFLHVLAALGHRDGAPAPLPLARFLTYATLAVLLVATPLFAVLPRTRVPYLVGQGGAGLGFEQQSFAEEVTLDSIGLTRDNPEVVMRLRFPAPPPPGYGLRLKAGAHDLFRRGVWQRTPEGGETLSREPGMSGFRLAAVPRLGSVDVWLRPLLGTRVPLPIEATWLEMDTFAVTQSRWGTVSLLHRPAGVVQYHVGLAPAPVDRSAPPEPGRDAPTLDLEGVTAEMAALAAEVARGAPRERAAALERFFHTEYEYTLDFVGRAGDKPLEDFLFRYRSGHCEYFASAMVLLLRSQGVHARLVTGFLGAEFNPLEGYYIVRQSNSHAWVEAYLPGEGWATFDPTPAADRPAGQGTGLLALVGQAYDYLMFRWDRYVVSYGFYDQMRVFLRLRRAWESFWASLSRNDEAAATEAGEAGQAEVVEGQPAAPQGWRRTGVALFSVAALLAVGGGWLLRRRRAAPPAASAYMWLRQRLARHGLAAGEAIAPLAVKAAAESRWPGAAEPTGRIVDFYLRESFGARPLDEGERRLLLAARSAAARGLGGPATASGSRTRRGRTATPRTPT